MAQDIAAGDMGSLIHPALGFIAAHPNWAVAVMFVSAFGESFAFVSLFFPGTSLLIAAGALVSTAALPALPVIAGAVLGAILGDGVSFWIGGRFGGGLGRLWPFSANPDLLQNGIRFFARHGGKSVFIGRFFGPLRAVIPLAAGLMHMPRGWFWAANILSAVVWAPTLLLFGQALGEVGEYLFGNGEVGVIIFAVMTLVGIGGVIWAVLRTGRSRE